MAEQNAARCAVVGEPPGGVLAVLEQVLAGGLKLGQARQAEVGEQGERRVGADRAPVERPVGPAPEVDGVHGGQDLAHRGPVRDRFPRFRDR